jgi:hypothetical protein
LSISAGFTPSATMPMASSDEGADEHAAGEEAAARR